MDFGFVGPAYRSQSVNADCQVLMNQYLEHIESEKGKARFALYQTPGLNLLYNLGNQGLRGTITAQGRTFAVAGNTLWELLPPNANPNKINRGNVGGDGLPVSLSFGPTQVLIVSAGQLYCFQLVASNNFAANTLNLIPPFAAGTGLGLLGTPFQTQYAGGFFFALMANSNTIQASNPLDGSTWQGVSETGVQDFPDNVVAIFENQQLLWVFGPKATQPFFNAGGFPFPYAPIESAKVEMGLAAPFAVVKADNTIFWMGADERGNGVFHRANGYFPFRVSTHAMEFEWSTYATIADCFAFSYQDQGHLIIQLNFPTAQKTWCYDITASRAAGMPIWFQKGYWNLQAGIFTMHRAFCHTFNFGLHLVGDPTTGAVYQQSINFFSDNGNPIRRLRRAPHISEEQEWVFHSKLQLDVEGGIGPLLQGSAPPTVYNLIDAAGNGRAFQIQENGIIAAPLSGTTIPADTLFLNDANNTTSWQVTINAQGEIHPALQAQYNPAYPVSIPFISTLGDQSWTLELDNLGNGIAILQAIPQGAAGAVGRGPEVTLRWSDDGGQSFSNGVIADCGQPGKTRTRVQWFRLGRSRDRVYEISYTDPAPLRIIGAYLKVASVKGQRVG